MYNGMQTLLHITGCRTDPTAIKLLAQPVNLSDKSMQPDISATKAVTLMQKVCVYTCMKYMWDDACRLHRASGVSCTHLCSCGALFPPTSIHTRFTWGAIHSVQPRWSLGAGITLRPRGTDRLPRAENLQQDRTGTADTSHLQTVHIQHTYCNTVHPTHQLHTDSSLANSYCQ